MLHPNSRLIRPLDCHSGIAMPPGSTWAVPSTTLPCLRIARQSPCAGLRALRPTFMPWPTGSKLAEQDRGHGTHGSLLEPPLPNFGSAGFCCPLGQRPPRQTRTGRKTASADCQWRPKLHTFGRLNSAFRPPMTSGYDGPTCASATPSSALRPPASSTGKRLSPQGTCHSPMSSVTSAA